MAPAAFIVLLSLGCSDSTIKTFTEPPTVTITTPAPEDEVDQAVEVVLQGLVTDSEYSSSLSSLSAQWSVGGTAICDGAVVDDGGNVECVHAFATAGDQTLRLTVTNPDGASAVAEQSIVVVPNTAPTAAITAPMPGDVLYSDQLTIFEAYVEDAEDSADALSAAWTSSLDGDLEIDDDPTSAGDLSGAALLSEGDHLITLTVTDSTGLTGEDTVLLTVGAANTPPDCAITAPENNASYELGATVLFEGTADDLDVPATDLLVDWRSNLDGTLSTDVPTSSGSMSFAASGMSQGTHTITLTVTDEVGADCSDAILVTIGSGPAIEIIDPSTGDVFNDGDSVAFTATVSDSDDSPTTLDLLWESSLDGELSSTGANSSGTAEFSTRALSVGEHTITVTATDPDGFYGNDSILLTINGLPSTPVVEISPDPATSSDDLLASITTPSVDPEGDSVSYRYAWYQNSSLTSYTTEAVPASATENGDTWRVEVTGTDGTGDSEVGTDSVSIGNSPPSLASVSIDPSSPVEGDTLICVPSGATDPDGDTVSYTYGWTVNSTSTGTTASTLASTWFARGDDVTCTATPYDGTDYGSAVTSDPVTIGNSAPVLSRATLSPTEAYEATTLSCTPGSSTDADEDTVSHSYDWIVDGTRLGLDSSSLDGSWFDKDEDVVCEVTPHDDADSGDPVESNTVTISNTPPQVSSATISPSSPTEGSTLSCSAGSTSDDDGDTVSVSYGWLVDGSDIGVTSSTLTGSSFDRGDEVACQVVPSDGTDDGVAVTSDTVTIGNSAPTLGSVELSPSDPSTDDDITASVSGGTDADGDTVTYTYAWYVNDGLVSETSSVLDASDTEKGDEIYVIVTPYDGTDYGTAVTSSTVTVGNSVPELSSVTLSPTDAYESTTLTCTPGSVSDDDGDAITYSYDWSVAGTTLGLDSSTLTGAWFDKEDDVTCTVTPSDDEDSGDPVESNTVTISNSPPQVSSVSISPSSPTESSTIYCSAGSTSDDDGDSVSVSYGWLVEGADIGVTTTTLSGSSFDKGDTVACYVVPNDGTEDGTRVTSDTITVGNTAPTLTEVELSPLTPFTDDDITATVTGGSDTDGDSISYSYAWYINDGRSSETGATLDSSEHEKHDEVYVVVTPYDGTDYGTAVSSDPVDIENTPPTAPTVEITPTDAEPEDDLVCTVTTASTDLDEDSLTYVYAWSLSGVDAGVSDSTLDASYTYDGDSWTCTVQAWDGDDYSSAASDSQSVVDRTAPDQPIISSIDPYRNETIVDLDGTAEAGSEVTVTMECDDGTVATASDTVASDGSWSVSLEAPAGVECDFVAVAVDDTGNVSDDSNVVSTETCDPVDDYEDDTDLGDTCDDAVDDWTVLADDGDSVSIIGNIVDTTDEDWYVFETSQSVTTYGTNTYKFEVAMIEGSTEYAFAVYRGDCGSAALECDDGGGEGDGWTQYDFYAQDTVHSISDSRYCYTGSPAYNNCDDLSDTYYVHVWRTSSGLSCGYYELEISNGDW